MARALKPYKVDQVTSEDGYSRADVFFNRNTKDFFVDCIPGDIGSRVEGKVLDDVKRRAQEHLSNTRSYEWVQMIEVTASDPSHQWDSRTVLAGIDLHIRRFERAPHPQAYGEFVERRHRADSENFDDRIRHYNGNVELGPRRSESGRCYAAHLLPYDQELWETLLHIQSAIEESMKRLVAIVGSKSMSKLLERLPAPAPLQLPKVLPFFSKKPPRKSG